MKITGKREKNIILKYSIHTTRDLTGCLDIRHISVCYKLFLFCNKHRRVEQANTNYFGKTWKLVPSHVGGGVWLLGTESQVQPKITKDGLPQTLIVITNSFLISLPDGVKQMRKSDFLSQAQLMNIFSKGAFIIYFH